jgi:bis(5'-nucleosyl)-tetraphosphatase (symmetrical)
MEFSRKDEPVNLPPGYMPWFSAPQRRSRRTPVIFGHWAALGLYTDFNVFGVDTGCVWGRTLSAFRLSDRKLFQLACRRVAHSA